MKRELDEVAIALRIYERMVANTLESEGNWQDEVLADIAFDAAYNFIEAYQKKYSEEEEA